MNATASDEAMEVPCCPALAKDTVCDVLDFHYRTRHTTNVAAGGRRIQVEVLIHARLERCPGPMTLGDLVYSTTLLPGEKVRLFTADRRTRFSIDSESKVSYRHEQTSEERFYLSSMHDFMSDVSVRDSGSANSSNKGSARGHGETSSALGAIFSGPSVDVSGSYDASSTSSFLHELSQHASASDRRSESATRAASSVSVGEVSSRSHTQGESEDHQESSSREFSMRSPIFSIRSTRPRPSNSKLSRFSDASSIRWPIRVFRTTPLPPMVASRLSPAPCWRPMPTV